MKTQRLITKCIRDRFNPNDTLISNIDFSSDSDEIGPDYLIDKNPISIQVEGEFLYVTYILKPKPKKRGIKVY